MVFPQKKIITNCEIDDIEIRMMAVTAHFAIFSVITDIADIG